MKKINRTTHPHEMFRVIMATIEKKNKDNVAIIINELLADLKERYEQQQKKLDEIKKAFSKIEKERLKKKKNLDQALFYFNGVYAGQLNKNNLPDGQGHILFRARDMNYPDDTDMFVGEFSNGTKTGIGKYTYLSNRNIAKHPFTIPHYIGEWSGDTYYGLGSTIIDKFDHLQIFEGEFCNNKIFGFGKYTQKTKEGEIELIGYFDNGTAIGFGVRIEKDKDGKIINERSGLCEYDNTDENNKQSTLYLQFKDDNFWNGLATNPKHKTLIKQIYKEVFEKVYFNQEIRTEAFKKLKLKVQSLLIEFLLEINEQWHKNSNNNKFIEFVNQQADLKAEFESSETTKHATELEKKIKNNIATFKSLKKTLMK